MWNNAPGNQPPAPKSNYTAYDDFKPAQGPSQSPSQAPHGAAVLGPGLSLKGELTDNQAWPTRAGARRAIVDYIGWYNGTRLHSTLGYRSPAEFEASARKETLQQVA